MESLIFDIDGTLVESTDFDTRLYRQAVSDVLGTVNIYDDWDEYVHVTDGGILRQILKENEVQEPTSAFDAVKARFVALVEDHLGNEPCKPIRGAERILRRLNASGACQVGIATGGWKRTAEAKLESAGLVFPGIPLFSSDDAEDREEIMGLCLKGLPESSRSVTYVGDGPWDLRASEGLGWGFIAIGRRLQGMHKPWIRDFEDMNALFPALF